ncbi:hypothetical protein [Psychrobacter sp. Pi2-52]|uniref:hypothetical protein n=1 Tax=Psychrobacter TaxID=497 RepID=UPI001917A6F3|nr:hypothetical protein [Psychrobacter sp. Pi2-52]
MSKDNKANLRANHGQHSDSQPHKLSLLFRFMKFISWVIVIGLLLSPLACTVQIIDDIKEQQGGNDE